jgi:hypothetical protein
MEGMPGRLQCATAHRAAKAVCQLMTVLRFYRRPNGLRYLRWGGDGEAVQLENADA